MMTTVSGRGGPVGTDTVTSSVAGARLLSATMLAMLGAIQGGGEFLAARVAEAAKVTPARSLPVVRRVRGRHRNGPCPCGCGRKAKRCGEAVKFAAVT
jgi:hypothetical protein